MFLFTLIFVRKYPQRNSYRLSRVCNSFSWGQMQVLQAGFVRISWDHHLYAFNFSELFNSDITLKLCWGQQCLIKPWRLGMPQLHPISLTKPLHALLDRIGCTVSGKLLPSDMHWLIEINLSALLSVWLRVNWRMTWTLRVRHAAVWLSGWVI